MGLLAHGDNVSLLTGLSIERFFMLDQNLERFSMIFHSGTNIVIALL